MLSLRIRLLSIAQTVYLPEWEMCSVHIHDFIINKPEYFRLRRRVICLYCVISE